MTAVNDTIKALEKGDTRGTNWDESRTGQISVGADEWGVAATARGDLTGTNGDRTNGKRNTASMGGFSGWGLANERC